ncbi:MAG: outer membrane beta-barrel protein [Alphaproteobacteria bacterium]|nr:outer membrane beta-barrel protein [Alphaproteobacteria bacterium]
MNKLAAASLAILATSLIATSAHAEKRWPNWYVGLHGGWAMDDGYDATTGGVTTEVNTDGGGIIGASLGYVPPTQVPFFDMTRYELEYSYRNNDNSAAGGSDFESHTTMLNMLVDFKTDNRWNPYVGGGVGMTSLDVGGEDDSTFAWQLMAGLEYAPTIMPMTLWGVRYRYLGASDADINNGGINTEYEYDSHSIEATARFRF